MFFASRQVNDTLHWQSPHSVNTAVIFFFNFQRVGMLHQVALYIRRKNFHFSHGDAPFLS